MGIPWINIYKAPSVYRHWPRKLDFKGNNTQSPNWRTQNLCGGSPKSRWKLNANKTFPFLPSASWFCTDRCPKDCSGSFQRNGNTPTKRKVSWSPVSYMFRISFNVTWTGIILRHHSNTSGNGAFIWKKHALCTYYVLDTVPSVRWKTQKWIIGASLFKPLNAFPWLNHFHLFTYIKTLFMLILYISCMWNQMIPRLLLQEFKEI